MFERFTDRARRVVIVAQEEARAMQHNFIGTEHLLLGLLQCGGVAQEVLEDAEIDLETTRERILSQLGKGKEEPPRHIPFTPRTKKVLGLALREALQLGHNWIGTEHILLAMIRHGEGLGCRFLAMDISSEKLRQSIIIKLHGRMSEKAEEAIDRVAEKLEKQAAKERHPASGILAAASGSGIPATMDEGEAIAIPDQIRHLSSRIRTVEKMLGL